VQHQMDTGAAYHPGPRRRAVRTETAACSVACLVGRPNHEALLDCKWRRITSRVRAAAPSRQAATG
jgi:hypothetical protein